MGGQVPHGKVWMPDMAGTKAKLIPIVCSGLKRSASTWSYNVCRELFQRTLDPAKVTFVATYAGDTDKMLEELARETHGGKPRVALIKAHDLGPATLTGIRAGRIRNVYTVRDPRDALASMIRFWPPTPDNPFETYLGNFQRWLMQGETLMRSGTSLVIRYEDMMDDSAACIEAVARYLKLPERKQLIARVDAATSVESHRKIIDRIEEQAEDPDAAFDPTRQLHRRHIDSGEVGRWRRDLSQEQRRRAVVAFLPWLVSMGYAEEALRAAVEAQA